MSAEEVKAPPKGFMGNALGFLGTYSELLLRLTVRRLIWAVAAVTLTLLYVNSKEPSRPANLSQLREFARLLTPAGETFEGNNIAGAHGTMVIVHGMRDGWVPREGDGPHWTTGIFNAVRERTGVQAPQMIVVDWHELSRPSDALPGTDLFPQFRIIEDVAGIKPQAQEIGGFLGMRLIRLIEEGVIARDKPLHLIGHSAGGFVGSRAAIVMDAMKRAPEKLHVTILDTPFPGREITHLLPKICRAEFYASSSYVNVEKENVDPQLHFVRLKIPDLTSFNEEHSYAWFSYREHILKEGFDRSPFAPKQ
ncbi:MAG: hypothetical protein ACPGVU_21205 [Limisphaerales bacterium]